ncbi:MAG: peptidylprolyl isomerase [Gammaproteobacteria bacterium]|nr:peptidylprolyl isomerase [Gammaproteobacteria bacterium]
MTDTIEKNKFVSLTYSITDETDEILERIDLPVPLILGYNSQLIEKIEQALIGKKQGDQVSVTLSAEEGFGPHLPELAFTDDIANVPPEFQHIGAEVQFQNDQGETKEFRVTRIENGKLTVDGNHPFAGKTITYNVTVVEVRDPTPEEMMNGVENQTLLH